MNEQNVTLALTLVLLAILLPPAALAEGSQTGTINGLVVDPAGIPLQGVAVRLSGPQLAREALTDAAGRCRFPALAPGRYRLEAELLGLQAAPQETDVFVSRTAEVRLTLGEAAAEPVVADTIQVVAETPVVDRFETRVGGNLRFEGVDSLPLARFYQSVAQILPGVSGGSDGNPNVSGSLRGANVYLVDGVDTTDPTTGLFGLNLAYEAVAEVDVTTAAAGAEYGRLSGGVVNVVTRSGGREFKGLARVVATDNDWTAARDYPSADVRHLQCDLAAADAGPDRLAPSMALSLGGPLVRDRLFFSTSWETSEQPFGRPTAVDGDWDENRRVDAGAVKLDWQPTGEHSIALQHTFDSADFHGFAPFDRRPAENLTPQTSDPRPGTLPAPGTLDLFGFFDVLRRYPGDTFAVEQRSQEGNFSKLQWSWTATQNLTFDVKAANQDRTLTVGPFASRGLTGDAPHLVALTPDIDELFIVNGVTGVGYDERPRQQANLAVSYFIPGRMDHEIDFGADFQETESTTALNVPGKSYVDPFFLDAFGFDVQIAGQLFIDIDADCIFLEAACDRGFNPSNGEFEPFARFDFWHRPPLQSRERSSAVYLSDTIALDRWVFRIGVRWELLEGEGDFSFFGESDNRELVDDEDVSPRVAVTWDPRGDGDVLFHAAWGRYTEPFLQQYLDTYNRLFPFAGATQYLWGALIDLDCSDVDPAAAPGLDNCWIPIDVMPPFPFQVAPPSPDLERSTVDELVVGFERRLSRQTGFSLHYVDRTWKDLWDDAPFLDGPPPPGGLPSETFRNRVDNLEIARRRYEGVQLMLRRAYADGWQLLASYTWSRTEGNLFTADGLDDFADFQGLTDATTVNRFGPAPYDRPHELRVYGSFMTSLGWADMTFAGSARYSDGTPFHRARSELVFAGMGGPLGDEAEYFDAIRFLTPRGSDRLSGSLQLDVALHFVFQLGGGTSDYGLELKAEVFNLTNERAQLAAESLVDDGLWGRPRTLSDLQAPRSFRLTLGLRF